MKKILILLIFFLAFILRFYQLGVNPPSLDWDEASLGYNAYSLFKTGKDEYGNFLPLSIRSFNDYKPPLYTYLTILPVGIFGLSEFSVRFISALFGFLTVIIGYLLIKEIFPKKNSIFYFLFTIFFSLSPWHLQFSRIAFEANLALFFFILGIFFFLKEIKNGINFIFSSFSFALSLYAYHSPRLIVPVLLLGLTIIFWQKIKEKLVIYQLSLILLFILLLPIIIQFRSSTAARFGSVSVINPDEKLGASIKAIEEDLQKGDFLGKLTHNRRIVYFREILAGYLDHFNFDFLFLTGDAPARHHASSVGMLYLWDLLFIIIGVLLLLNKLNQQKLLLFIWFLIAPLASALTSGTPHAVRSLLYLPTYQIFITIGVEHLIKYLKKRDIKKIFVFFFIFSFFIFNFYYYLHMYYIHTPLEESRSWQYGYRQVVETVSQIENEFDKVIVTYQYDQPYIYFLFYQLIDPIWYQKNWGVGEIERAYRTFGKYEFRNIKWEEDKLKNNVILIGTPGEIPENAPHLISQVNFLDGSVAFRIVAIK